MSEPIDIKRRRQYTKRQKVTAIIAATLTNPTAAAIETNTPRTNIRRWRDDPEMAEYGQKAREEIAEEARALSVKVLAEIRDRVREFEPKDLAVLFGILTDKGQLLAGHATTRSETRDITEAMSDHEREKLSAAIEEWLATHDDVPDPL